MFPRFKIWMQSLLYPAFHGAFLLTFLEQVNAYELTPFILSSWNPYVWPWGPREWLALLLLIYFGTLYVETEATEANSYGARTFFLDIAEVGVMTLAFCYLGYFGEGKDDVRGFYGASAVAFACPILWRLAVVGRHKNFYDLLCGAASLLALYSAWDREHEKWIIVVLWTFLLLYVADLALSRAWLGSRASGKRCLVPGTYRASVEPSIATRSVRKGATFDTLQTTSCNRTLETSVHWQLETAESTFKPMSLIALGVVAKPLCVRFLAKMRKMRETWTKNRSVEDDKQAAPIPNPIPPSTANEREESSES
jgi:hypothetical protein